MMLRAGDWVEVRSKEEILATLDNNGRLEGLPFMPQMFEYCGKRLKVFKRAHKTCDTINNTGGRTLPNAVHLEVRCNGKAHGDCHAACLIFWKEAWLRPIDEKAASAGVPSEEPKPLALPNKTVCTEEEVWKATRAQNQKADDETRYVCQATEMPHYTTRISWWDARQYIEDYASGNVDMGRIIRGLIYMSYWHIFHAKRNRIGRPSRWLYDWFQGLWGGIPFPRWKGTIPAGQSTPLSILNLQPGELVCVKSYKEILATVDDENKNRGMAFDAELVPYCGGTYRVRTVVKNFIDEKTGKMMSLKTPAVILEGVWCQARYSNRRFFCPRAIYSWWREAWLERVPENVGQLSDARLENTSETRQPSRLEQMRT
jgi:hypothetical protein